jgi:hypothetical protein
MKKLQYILLILILSCLSTHQSIGQKMEMIISGGSFSINNQSDFPRSRIGTNINFGMHYHLSEKWVIGTNYNLGHFSYVNPPLENIISGIPSGFIAMAQSGRVQQENFSFLAIRKIKLPLFDLRLELGTGLGMYFQRDEYYRGWSYDPEIEMFRGVEWVRDRIRGLHFPVNYSLKKSFKDRVVLGVSGGQFFTGELVNLGGYQGISIGFIF